MKTLRVVIVVTIMGFLLQACVVGNKHDITTVKPAWQGTTDRSIAVVVQDQRPYVLTGEKDPDFVGLQRGGFGNPFDVTTASRKPLADDFGNAIIAALSSKEAKVSALTVTPDETPEDVRSALAHTKADRQVLLTIKEWKADTYTNTALHYNLLISVLDADGTMLALQERVGEDDLGGSFMNPPAHAKTAVPAAFKRIIESLLNDNAILAALK